MHFLKQRIITGICTVKKTFFIIVCEVGTVGKISKFSCPDLKSQGPHSDVLMTGEVHNLYPKKSQVQNLSTQKNP